MIFTERTITVRKGTSTINESIILYRGDFQVGLKFTILDSKYKFLNGANLIESEKATYAQLAVLKPKGDNIFSDVVKCSEGSVTFTMTKVMIDELEEVGKYSFQIRLFDANKESRVSIPPVEYGMEVREPVASEDHNNEVNKALTGYSIAKVTTIEEDKKVDTFNSNGVYNKTTWLTGDRITENKLNKIEDALHLINQNKTNDINTISNKVDVNYNVLNSIKADTIELEGVKTQLNNLVLGAVGDGNNPEVIQARGEYSTLNDRIDSIDSIKNYGGNSYDTAKNALGGTMNKVFNDNTKNLWKDGVFKKSYTAGQTWRYVDYDYTGIIKPGQTYDVGYFEKSGFVQKDYALAIIMQNGSGQQLYRHQVGNNQTLTIPKIDGVSKIFVRIQFIVGDQAPSDGIAILDGIYISSGDISLRDDINIKAVNDTNSRVDELQDKMDAVIEETTINLFNKEDVVNGQYINGSQLAPNPAYNTSGFMKIKKVDPTYTFYSSEECRFICAYDANKKPLVTYEYTSRVSLPSTTVYVRVTVGSGINLDRFMCQYTDKYSDLYVPHNTEISVKGFGEMKSAIDKASKIIDDNFKKKSSNLLDPEKIEKNKYCNGSLIIGDNPVYSYIRLVRDEKEYTISSRGIMRFLVFTTELNQVISFKENVVSSVIPDGTQFIYATVFTADLDREMLKYGDPILEYEPFDDSYVLKNDVSDIVNKVFITSDNLANPRDFVHNHYIDNYGGMHPHDSYFVTGFIPVANKDYIVSSHWARFVSLYNRDKKFLRTYMENLGGGTAYKVESDVGYVRYTIRLTDMNKYMVNYGPTIKEYTPYGDVQLSKDYIDIEVSEDLQAKSMYGSDTAKLVLAKVEPDTLTEIKTFPKHLKKCVDLSFGATFNTFNTIEVGKGYNNYRGSWIRITNTTVDYIYYDNNTAMNRKSVVHNLNISTFINVSINVDSNSTAHVKILTLNGYFETTFNFAYELNGFPFIRTAAVINDVTFSATSSDFKRPMWLFGDSYFGIANNRVIGQLRNLGFFNVLINGLAGQGSAGAFSELEKCLLYGTPKYIVWCLGMNDAASSYNDVLGKLVTLCENKNITLILMKIPSVPDRSKEQLNEYMLSTGLRYVDAYKAVGAQPNGTWYPNYLDGDKVHPKELGAKAIAFRILLDAPEIMQYGLYNYDDVSGDISGDR